MFGTLTVAREILTPEEDARYRAAYCGLCRNLRRRYGQKAGLTLNYDLCFLILFLESLYEPDEKEGKAACLMHPFKPRLWWESACTEYAADMNLALSYLKLRDDWEDDGSITALTGSTVMKSVFLNIRERWPRQCNTMQDSIRKLREIEKAKTEDPDAAAETFAELMAEVFVFRRDRWESDLRGCGAALGRFLYISDACLDLERDSIRGNYNPFRRRYGLRDNREYFQGILQMLLGECLFYFDRLPLVKDTGLLKNILCFGLWGCPLP